MYIVLIYIMLLGISVFDVLAVLVYVYANISCRVCAVNGSRVIL